MKKHSGIIKEIGILLLLFVSVSAIAVSENTNVAYTDNIAVFGVDSVVSSNGGATNYEDENSGSSEVTVIVVKTSPPEDIGNTNNDDGTVPEDSGTGGNPDPDVMPPNFNSDDIKYEERGFDEWLELLLSSITAADMAFPSLSD